MADLFFFGTLRHIPLLELVLGRPADALDLQSGRLHGHGAYAVVDQVFPTIEARAGEAAVGLLARGLSDVDLAALNFYEGGFSYDLKPVEIELDSGEIAPAQVYFPQPGLWEAGEGWDLGKWVRDWGALSMRAAEEVMSYQGRMTAEDIAQRIHAIRIRAAAWLATQAGSDVGERDLSRDVVVHRHTRPYLNFFAMEEMDLQYRRHDGDLSPVINRAAILVGHAAAVLPYDPVRDQVLLVEQFRASTFIAGDQNPWIWEPVAGLVEPGETPETTAHREAMEEAGVTLNALEPVSRAYSSTGSSGEFLHTFIGVTDLSNVRSANGVAAEGEDIRSKILSFDQLMHAVDTQEFRILPLITASLWLARHRDRLRQTAGVSD
ncbi:NUDIX domain-containing protein [Rhodobacteraceae bacterium M382]|nr:NUDIX domain-containing protein [Rhodobacteraceae bacterium M382]